MGRPDLPRASAFNADHIETERPVYPPCAYPPAACDRTDYGVPPATVDDFLSAEIRRDVPIIVRIAFLGAAGIVAASIAGFIVHQIISAF